MSQSQQHVGSTSVSTIRTALHSTAGTYEWLSLVFNKMSATTECHQNCSGHGTCENGECVCLVQFSGEFCQDKNLGYFFAFGSIFVALSIVAVVQLILCIQTEYMRQKHKSMRKIFKLNAQKLLYILTIFATAIRGIYFFTKWSISDTASSNLASAFYPILLSGFTFIICFWAEAFHLGDLKLDKPRFLGKSILAFLLLNFIMYSMLFIQLIATDVIEDDAIVSRRTILYWFMYIMSCYYLQSWRTILVMYAVMQDDSIVELVTDISNGCFACLMIIAVVFFLIYGVEVYFKVHGAFKSTNMSVDPLQLHMSRLGLLAQAMLQLVTALFIIAEIKRDIWKNQLHILSQNCYDIGFRIVEFGVVLWFPCVLWNCKRPENLWVLNPKTLFKRFEFTESDAVARVSNDSYGSIYHEKENKADCWICYDPDRTDAGVLIQPCQCRGDVASVHHECLRKWLIECADQEKELKCKVCNEQYKVHEGWSWVPKGLKPRHWLQYFIVIIVITASPFATYAVTHSVTSSYIRILLIGICVLIEIGCIRILAAGFGICYKRGRLSTLTIVGREVHSQNKDSSSPQPTCSSTSQSASLTPCQQNKPTKHCVDHPTEHCVDHPTEHCVDHPTEHCVDHLPNTFSRVGTSNVSISNTPDLVDNSVSVEAIIEQSGAYQECFTV